MTNGDFSYDPESRTLRGILLPFGELSRMNITGTEPAMFSADSITLPRDPSVVTINRRHNRYDPVGRATHLEKRKEGVYAEFRIADTDEGDDYLRTGDLRKLSAEVAGMVRDGVKVIASKLTGAALVTEGAFAGAALFAIADDIATDIADDLAAVVATLRGDLDTLTASINNSTDADQADTTDQEEALMSAATNIVPDGLAVATPRPTLDGLFAALARNNPDDLRQYAGAGDLFALANVQDSGPSGATIGADVRQVGYLGELWSKLPYQRRYIPLISHETLTNYEMKGWRWVPGKEPQIGDYSGNVTDVPSNAVDTEPVTVTASRLAGGHVLDRRFTDFGDQSVVSSYLTHQADDYKRKTDAKALAAIVAAATATTPGAVPAGIAKGLAAIVDGALDVIASENRPAFSLVSPELWRDIILTPKDDILAFLNAGFGLEEGDVEGFKILPAPVGVGKVITGAKEGETFYELGGEAPIRVDGVKPGQGANEVAVFGYYATLTNNAAAIRSVTVAAA